MRPLNSVRQTRNTTLAVPHVVLARQSGRPSNGNGRPYSKQCQAALHLEANGPSPSQPSPHNVPVCVGPHTGSPPWRPSGARARPPRPRLPPPRPHPGQRRRGRQSAGASLAPPGAHRHRRRRRRRRRTLWPPAAYGGQTRGGGALRRRRRRAAPFCHRPCPGHGCRRGGRPWARTNLCREAADPSGSGGDTRRQRERGRWERRQKTNTKVGQGWWATRVACSTSTYGYKYVLQNCSFTRSGHQCSPHAPLAYFSMQ